MPKYIGQQINMQYYIYNQGVIITPWYNGGLMATWLLGSITSSNSHEQVKEDGLLCTSNSALAGKKWMLQPFILSTLIIVINQQWTVSGIPRLLLESVCIQVCHTVIFTLWETECNLQKKCSWFSRHFKSAEFLCKGWKILYVFELIFTFFNSNRLPQNLRTFFEIYRSATGLQVASHWWWVDMKMVYLWHLGRLVI